jgi:TldD protein
MDLRSMLAEVQSMSDGLYTELRWQENRDQRMSYLNGQLTSNSQETATGLSARAFKEGYWGFASRSEPTLESARLAVQEAVKNARFLGSRGKKGGALLPAKATSLEKSYATTKPKQSTGFWIHWLKQVDDRLLAKFPALKARQVTMTSLEMEKKFVTTDGASVHSLVPRAHLAIVLTVDSESGPVRYMDVRGGLGEKEDHFGGDVSQLDSWLDEMHKIVQEKAKGVMPESGEHEVILAPDLAGILAHEAVGHTVEGDLVMGGSVAGDCMNQRVGSDLVTLVDFAHTYAGTPAPQPVHVDDEGVEAKDTVIIEKGILKHFMNNRETAHHFHQAATGHARAFKFYDEPLIRMRNTAILPGDASLEDMIKSVKKGYFLAGAGNGQADTTGEFMFAVNRGYEIVDGKLGRPLREATISGVAFEMLKSVSMVSRDFEWESSGYCGKKQPMPVGMGGPALKCRVAVGGQ